MTRNEVKRAFTLIELLVVIAIVGILAGLLLPVLARAKAVTRTVQNKNNLKQIASAFTMYESDNNGLAVGVGDSTGKHFFGHYGGAGQQVDFSGGYLSLYVGNTPKVLARSFV